MRHSSRKCAYRRGLNSHEETKKWQHRRVEHALSTTDQSFSWSNGSLPWDHWRAFAVSSDRGTGDEDFETGRSELQVA